MLQIDRRCVTLNIIAKVLSAGNLPEVVYEFCIRQGDQIFSPPSRCGYSGYQGLGDSSTNGGFVC